MLKIHWKCAKHPRYNPEVEGEAGIRGGCTVCYELYTLYRSYVAATRRLRDE